MVYHYKDDIKNIKFTLDTPLNYSKDYTFIPINVKSNVCKKFMIQTPKMFTPFGIQENMNYKDYIMISFKNSINDSYTKKFYNEIYKKFKDLTKTLNLSNDDFIRTTEKRHYKSVEAIWNRLLESGDIYLSKYAGWYSVSDEAYYSEDEIISEGGKKIAKTSGSLVDWFEEESYFFKLSAWQEKLLDHYKKYPNFISPKSRNNEIVQFVKSGLIDLSVSRTSFKWGIQVPNNDKHKIGRAHV